MDNFQSEEDQWTTLSIVSNSNWGTFSPVFLNILLQVEASPSVFSAPIQQPRRIRNCTIALASLNLAIFFFINNQSVKLDKKLTVGSLPDALACEQALHLG